MNHPYDDRRSPETGHQELLNALTGCTPHLELAVDRTRRNVQNTWVSREEFRRQRRRNAGLGLLIALISLTLLAPALWTSVDSFASGGHFGDMQTQSYLLGVMLFPGIVAAAVAGFSRLNRHEPRS